MYKPQEVISSLLSNLGLPRESETQFLTDLHLCPHHFGNLEPHTLENLLERKKEKQTNKHIYALAHSHTDTRVHTDMNALVCTGMHTKETSNLVRSIGQENQTELNSL